MPSESVSNKEITFPNLCLFGMGSSIGQQENGPSSRMNLNALLLASSDGINDTIEGSVVNLWCQSGEDLMHR